MKKITITLLSILFLSLSSAQDHFPTNIGQRLLAGNTISVSHSALSDNEVLFVEKSPARAAIYSLIVPGAGEWYVGRFDHGQYSLAAEGVLWLTYASFLQYGNWIQDDARTFANVHAGASVDGKDDQFFVNVGNFGDVYEYNEKKLRDRSLSRVYDPSAGFGWQWDSDINRQKFRAMRVSSDKVFNNSRFVIAAVLANHIISAVNAARLARYHNMQNDAPTPFLQSETMIDPKTGMPDGLRIDFSLHF